MDFGFFKALREAWPTVSAAPWSFGAVFVIALAVGFGVSTLWWSGTVSTMRERVSLYQERLQGASPDQAAQRIAGLEARIKQLEPHPQRRLSDEQKQKLLAAITPIAKEIQLLLVFSDSAESSRYAIDFMRVFKKAGVTTFGPTQAFGESGEDRGVLVGLINQDKPSDLAKKYIEALQSTGLEIKTTRWGSDIVQFPPQLPTDFDLFICED